MDQNFTNKLQEYINTPAEKRNLEQGAIYLLQLTNNKILYKNISRNLPGHAQYIEFRIKRYLQFRLQDLTHNEVEEMQKKVNVIVQNHALDKVNPSGQSGSLAPQKTDEQEWRGGKRADHDKLPAEIQALYVENASIMQKMRELHLQLRNLSTANSTCPDSDRYPFLKELISLDKRYHDNWKAYDAASAGTPSRVAEQTLQEQARKEQKDILRKLNLAKGRFKKTPSDKNKETVRSLYQQLTAPSEALTAELKQLGIL